MYVGKTEGEPWIKWARHYIAVRARKWSASPLRHESASPDCVPLTGSHEDAAECFQQAWEKCKHQPAAIGQDVRRAAKTAIVKSAIVKIAADVRQSVSATHVKVSAGTTKSFDHLEAPVRDFVASLSQIPKPNRERLISVVTALFYGRAGSLSRNSPVPPQRYEVSGYFYMLPQ